jgi:hypothetical protein
LGAMTPAEAQGRYIAVGSFGERDRDPGTGFHDRVANETGATVKSPAYSPELGGNPGTGGVFASSTPNNNGTLAVSFLTGADYDASANAELRYTFSIAPKPNVVPSAIVPLHVFAFADTINGYSTTIFQSAQFVMSQPGVDGVSARYEGYNWQNGDDGRMWTVDQYVSFQPDVPISVYMWAAIGTSFTGAGSGGVYVDPLFELDPVFASQYDLVGLPAGQTSPVPEPSTWVLSILGFGLVGSTMRRRKASVSFA